MRVFLAGATGVVGRPLVDRLLELGHQVTGMTRSPERAAALRAKGADGVVCDAFDADAVRAAVVASKPDVVVHELTDLPHGIDNPRKYGEMVAGTNRLRRETAATFVAAARAAGAGRLVAQSISFISAPRDDAWVVDEDSPVWVDAPGPIGEAVRATQVLERTVTGAEGLDGVVLRYGYFYGQGTWYAPDGSQPAALRRRRVPIVGRGTGCWSWIHIDDAVSATVLALDHGGPGVYNIVDDDPAPVREWLPALARAAGAKPPRRVPAWIARLVAGPYVIAAMVEQRGASNAKAKRELGLELRYPSWREGFPAVFA